MGRVARPSPPPPPDKELSLHLNGEENPNAYVVLRRVGPAQQPPTPTACILGPSALISPLLFPRSLGSFPALDLRVSALAVPSA